jgi:hypothetical protein
MKYPTFKLVRNAIEKSHGFGNPYEDGNLVYKFVKNKIVFKVYNSIFNPTTEIIFDSWITIFDESYRKINGSQCTSKQLEGAWELL